MSLCGCGRISASFSRYLTSSTIKRRILIVPSVNLLFHRPYRRGKGVVLKEIKNLSEAKNYISLLTPKERSLVSEALKIQEELEKEDVIVQVPTVKQLKLAAIHSAVPFIGFGFLDNAIMIMAGEYIDMTIGVTFGISTMAAAALGNIVSDVSGIGLAHYVELAANKLGFEGPGLSSKQMQLPRTRFVTNLARAIGIIIGCLVGMFPLLFLEERDDKEATSS